MNYDYNKKFGLLKFYSGYVKFNLNSPKGYSLKIINAQTDYNTFYKYLYDYKMLLYVLQTLPPNTDFKHSIYTARTWCAHNLPTAL